MSPRLFFFAGEKSGDLLGSYLLKALKEKLPHYRFEGVGGPEMRSAKLKCLMRTEEFELHGFSDLLKSFPKLKRQFYTIRDHILKHQPEAVVLIDYPGFNLRMAKALRKKGYSGKVIQYISPTVWAWGEKRTQVMEENLDLLMTIYPFEAECFKNTSLNVKYVGNPIKEIIGKHEYDPDWSKLFGIKETENLVSIFPGSRKGEIQLNLPYQLKAAEMLKREDPDIKFAISCAHDKIMPVMHNLLANNTLKLNKDIFLLPKGYSYELMKDSKSAIAKSGTVTLELALHNCPTVVIYKLTQLNRLIAKYWMRLKLPHYCIVNLLEKKRIFPELIESGLTSKNVYQEVKALHYDTEKRKECIKECQIMSAHLKDYQTSTLAAQAVEEQLR